MEKRTIPANQSTLRRVVMYLAVVLAILAWMNFGSKLASAQAPLLKSSDVQYIGAFRLPQGANLDYGGNTLGYNPGSGSPGSLLIGCNAQTTNVAEVSIPTTVNSPNINSLNTAKLLQSCADPTAGATRSIGSGTAQVGGMLVYNGKLITSMYIYYDASNSQTNAFFVKPNTNLNQANASGAYAVSAPNIGFVDGWMAPIPTEWQSALKGPVASGNNSLQIISRTSWGPDAFSWDPAKFTDVNTTIQSTPLHYYTTQNPTLGLWNDPTPVNNTTVWWQNSGSGYRAGGVIPNGTRSILFFGSQGMGAFCYGMGGASGGDCHDPADSNKGVHGYPYQFRVMAFDLNDLAAVAAGTKQPYAVLPYAAWPLTTGIIGVDGQSNEYAGGAVYDPVMKRIYFSTPYTDGALPLIQVFQVNAGSPTVPAAPSGLEVR